MPYCPECGSQINEGAKFCENCGHKLPQRKSGGEERQKPEAQQRAQQPQEKQQPQGQQAQPQRSSQPQQQYRQPTRRRELKKPFYKKAPFIAVIIALLIGALIGGAYFILLTGDDVDEDSDKINQDSPESTFEAFTQRLNENDGEGAMELTEIPLVEDQRDEEDLKEIEEFIDDGEMEINDYEIKEVTYIDDMDSENRSFMEDWIDFIEENSTAEVENSCIIEVNATIYIEGDTEEGEFPFPMFKADGEWYVGMLYLMMGDTGGEDQVLVGQIYHRDTTVFEVASIHPNPYYDKVEITVFNGSSDQTWEGYLDLENWHFLSDDDEVRGGSRFDVSGIGVTQDDMEYVEEVVLQVDGIGGYINYEM